MEPTFKILNDIYRPVCDYVKGFLTELEESGYRCEWGFFNNHSVKQNNEWVIEYYPIPIITVKELCDVGFDMRHTFIERKLEREKAISLDWSVLSEYKFEVYGTEDYLNDFYNDSLTLDGICARIERSREQEIGISVMFGYLDDKDKLLDAIRKLETIGK